VIFFTFIKGIKILKFAPRRAFRRKKTAVKRNRDLKVRAA
jgi:hypothetical protein